LRPKKAERMPEGKEKGKRKKVKGKSKKENLTP
jgi:hypothetical protein